MHPTTIRGAVSALFKNQGFLSLLGGVLSAALTQALGFLFAHYADRLGIPPEKAALIPGIADKLTIVIGAAIVAFMGHEGLTGHGVDAAQAAAGAARERALAEFWPGFASHFGLPAGTPIPANLQAALLDPALVGTLLRTTALPQTAGTAPSPVLSLSVSSVPVAPPTPAK